MLHLALATSWLGGRAERRRALLIAVASAIVATVALVGTSAMLFSHRVAERAEARAAAPADDDHSAQLALAALYDETPDGEQIYLYWWQYLEPTARIPGIDGQPEPGSWFVSPALFDRIEAEPGLRARFPAAVALDRGGVGNPEELVAHRIVGAEVTLPEQVTFVSTDGWFGLTADLSWQQVAGIGLLLVLIPGAGLLVAVMSVGHQALERRLGLLQALGGGPSARRWLATLEALMTAGPGVVVAAVMWLVVSPRLEAVPLVGRRALEGDLAIGPIAAVAACTGVLTLLAAVTAARGGRGSTNRPSQPKAEQASPARLLPLVLGVGLALAGAVVGGRDGPQLFVTGVLLASVAVTWAMPVLLDALGRVLARGHALAAWLAGRRLSYAAVTSSRSLLGFAAVLVLFPVIAAWYAVASRVDPPNPTPTQVVELRGVLTEPLADRLEREVPVVRIDVVTDPASGRDVLVGDCSAITVLVELEACASDAFVPGEAARPSLGVFADFAGSARPPAGSVPAGHLFISADWHDTEQALRRIVTESTNPTATVSTPARTQLVRSPIVDWILATAAAAGTLGGLALLCLLVSHASRTSRSRHRLRALGAAHHQVGRIAGLEAGLLIAAVGATSLALGSFASKLFLQIEPAASFPIVGVGALAAVVVMATVFGATGAALTATRTPTASGDDR